MTAEKNKSYLRPPHRSETTSVVHQLERGFVEAMTNGGRGNNVRSFHRQEDSAYHWWPNGANETGMRGGRQDMALEGFPERWVYTIEDAADEYHFKRFFFQIQLAAQGRRIQPEFLPGVFQNT